MVMKKSYDNGKLTRTGKALLGAMLAYEALLQVLPFGARAGTDGQTAKQKADEIFFANNQPVQEQTVDYEPAKGIATLSGDTLQLPYKAVGSVDDLIRGTEGKAVVAGGVETLVGNDGSVEIHPTNEYILNLGKIVHGDGDYGILPFRDIQNEVKNLASELKEEGKVKGYSTGQVYSALMNIVRRNLSKVFKEIDEDGNAHRAVPHYFLDASGNRMLGYMADGKDVEAYVPEISITPSQVRAEANKLFGNK